MIQLFIFLCLFVYVVYTIMSYGELKMTTLMIIRIDFSVKSKIAKLAKNEGKTVREVLQELIENIIWDICCYFTIVNEQINRRTTYCSDNFHCLLKIHCILASDLILI